MSVSNERCLVSIHFRDRASCRAYDTEARDRFLRLPGSFSGNHTADAVSVGSLGQPAEAVSSQGHDAG